MDYLKTVTAICLLFIAISIIEFLIIFYWYVKKKLKDDLTDDEIEALLK